VITRSQESKKPRANATRLALADFISVCSKYSVSNFSLDDQTLLIDTLLNQSC
jgi:hypothetical protein